MYQRAHDFTHILLLPGEAVSRAQVCLYLDSNIKGVEFYTVEIVRILYSLGIEEYNAVPCWAKEIIPYIIKHYGKTITK